VSVLISHRMRGRQREQLRRKDARLQKVVEVLNHLKVIKFHVWEDTFQRAVAELRAEELSSLRRFLSLQVKHQ